METQNCHSVSHWERVKRLCGVFQEVHCISNVKEVVVDMPETQFLQNLEFFCALQCTWETGHVKCEGGPVSWGLWNKLPGCLSFLLNSSRDWKYEEKNQTWRIFMPTMWKTMACSHHCLGFLFFLFSISMGLIIYSFHKIIYLPCLNRDQERPRSCLYEALRGIKVISGARVASEVEGPCPWATVRSTMAQTPSFILTSKCRRFTTQVIQGCATFWCLWATLEEEELCWATH